MYWKLSRKMVLIILMCLFNLQKVTGIMCVQCLSGQGEACISKPPPPKTCHGRDMSNCIVIEQRTPSGDLLRLIRTCGPGDIISDECDNGISEEGQTILVCHRTCDTDGCNRGRPAVNINSLLLFVLSPYVPYLFNLFLRGFKLI
ncbi:uncharacterized protein LOC143228114 [Tachypleus tridentatus]|uniref:uncharacterized protein LOC143228114 n=1 Tax=Tachypleus tridentatus TaxID=6853 RepID=UPI003FD47267